MVSNQVEAASERAAFAAQLTEHVVYLMGASFIVGSLFTILILMLLDFMQRNKLKRKDDFKDDYDAVE